MKKKLNAILILTLVLALALSCLAGCAKKDDGAAEPADSGESAGGKTKIALVLPGKKDDVSFNQAMYEGVMAYAENHAEEVEVKVVENIYETSDIEPTLIEYADTGYDVIIGHGYQFSEPVNTVAQQLSLIHI